MSNGRRLNYSDSIRFDFCKLSDAHRKTIGTKIDIAAYLEKVEEKREFTMKHNGEKNHVRPIYLHDDSAKAEKMNIWGDLAVNFNYAPGELIIIKDARVSEFKGKKELSSSFTSKIIQITNKTADIQRIKELIQWKKGSSPTQFPIRGDARVEEPKEEIISCIKDINKAIERNRVEGFFNIQAHVAHVKTKNVEVIYASCPLNTKCTKKAIFMPSKSEWQCSNCGDTFRKPAFRYRLSLKLNDGTGDLWATAFDDTGTIIMGNTKIRVDANTTQIGLAKNYDLQETKLLDYALYIEYEFRVQVKFDNLNNKGYPNVHIVKVKPIDYLKKSKQALQLFDEYKSS